jgi:uncharacterized protein
LPGCTGGAVGQFSGYPDRKRRPGHPSQPKRKRRGAVSTTQNRSKLAQPIAVFLVAKLLAYTVLGFLLGLVGQMVQLSLVMRAVLQIAIGIFMLGAALRMLNVHPIFRYFAFEPPAFIRRRLRRAAADGKESPLTTPIFLGLLTVLIPCGITQAMMAAALGTGNPLEGAALMFAFTLGTSPVFFAVAFFATQLGAKLEKNFMRFAAVVVLILSLVTIDGGITLAGSPYSVTRLVNAAMYSSIIANQEPGWQELQTYQPLVQGSDASQEESYFGDNVITVNVLNTGYDPRTVHAKANEPVKLRLVSDGVYSCSLAFVIPSLGEERYLDPTGVAWVDIPAQKKGTRIPFSCSMGMYTGVIVFDS